MNDYRKQLDTVLDALRDYNNEIKFGGLITFLALSYKLDLRENIPHFKRLLKKLELDGYLSVENVDTYFIKLDGYFSSYVRQYEEDNDKMVIIASTEAKRVCRERSLNYATWFAGFAALLLFLFQIFDHFSKNCH